MELYAALNSAYGTDLVPRLLNSGLSDSQVLDFTRANFADLYAAVKAQGLTGAPRYLDAGLSSDQSRAATQANFTDLYTLLGGASNTPNFINFTGINLSKYHSAPYSRSILRQGSSVMAGLGSGSTGAGDVDAVVHSWLSQLATALPGGSSQSMFGSHNQLACVRWSLDAHGRMDQDRLPHVARRPNVEHGCGGPAVLRSADSGGYIPVQLPDAIRWRLGTLNVNIDGGTNTPINQGLAKGFVTAPALTTTLGLHTLNLIGYPGSLRGADHRL